MHPAYGYVYLHLYVVWLFTVSYIYLYVERYGVKIIPAYGMYTQATTYLILKVYT